MLVKVNENNWLNLDHVRQIRRNQDGSLAVFYSAGDREVIALDDLDCPDEMYALLDAIVCGEVGVE